MNHKNFFVADPYNEKHIEKLTQFEERNNISHDGSDYLQKLRQQQKDTNEIEQILFYEKENQILDRCYLRGEKDIKTCYLNFAPLVYSSKTSEFLDQLVDYAFNGIGMEEVFLQIPSMDKKRINHCQTRGFESLGEENNMTNFVKGKEETKEMRIKS